MVDYRIIRKRFQDRRRRRAMLFNRSIVGGVRAINSLNQKVNHQSNHQQEQQRFDAFRLVQKHGANRYRTFELAVDVFDKVLLPEYREHPRRCSG